jgi:TM2 domain-containing membrane protein YozV
MVLAFLFPGAGHFYLGRRGRAVAFAVIVLVMFLTGLLLDGKIYVAERGKPLTTLAMFASMGTGLPYFIARMLGPFGNIASITFEYGTAFTLTAGLMNLLLVLDAFDISEQRKN